MVAYPSSHCYQLHKDCIYQSRCVKKIALAVSLHVTYSADHNVVRFSHDFSEILHVQKKNSTFFLYLMDNEASALQVIRFLFFGRNPPLLVFLSSPNFGGSPHRAQTGLSGCNHYQFLSHSVHLRPSKSSTVFFSGIKSERISCEYLQCYSLIHCPQGSFFLSSVEHFPMVSA